MTEDMIRVFDAHENNLKHVDVTIPKGQLVVFAGVSGSGKSSLAFDTLTVESSREWQAYYPLDAVSRRSCYRPEAYRHIGPLDACDLYGHHG